MAETQAHLLVKLVDTPAELEQAFRLRYQVFVEEAGNHRLFNKDKLEKDSYDLYCDHLIVKELITGRVVGTYRLLPGNKAMQHGGFYSETEFDLTPLRSKAHEMLELGRSCIAPDYRDGKVLKLLWKGIGQYLQENNFSYIVGCASLTTNGLEQTNIIYSMLKTHGLLKEEFGIQPLPTHRIKGLEILSVTCTEQELIRQLPPLIKGYYSLGAKMDGEPAFDPLFQTTDFFIILDVKKATRRFTKLLRSHE
ncbi:GNAT family N-acetyltransferase [Ammoniphilus sp. YIM 78166]|uniref:GNAT family N-acetyltransferase n=1 Tax=Ammoniphilus sp. YIM 78166 TaxID=1644106 RepID=UPI0010705020|nr:GNAT family N-acyltransferase [Ammoniphilus sp. YIM 78166]